MDRLIEVKVNGNYLTKDNNCAGVQGEGNITTLRIEFDPGWDEFEKTITWWNADGECPVQILLFDSLLESPESNRIYLIKIPPEPLALDGWCSFVIDGYIEDVRQRSVEDKLKVLPAKTAEAPGEPGNPTPSPYEQIQVEITGLLGDMDDKVAEAGNYAQNAQDSAAAAELAAVKAESSVGKTAYIGEDGNWYRWNSATGQFENTGINANGIPGENGKSPRVGENGNWYVWDDASGEYVDTGIIAGGAENCEERLSALEQRFEDMDYGNGIVINSFSHNQTGTKERGSVVTGLTLSWRFDRKPTTQTLTGPTLDSAGVSPTISGKEYSYPISGVSINADNQGSFRWKIAATDNRGKAVSQTSPGFTFYNCVYYGAADEPEVIDSLFIRSLGTKTSPTSGKPSGINVNGGGKYIWYCLPTGSGTCKFKSNGFPAGIELVDTIAFTNALGYTENYYVYRSNQKITDTVTIEVS